MNFSSESAEAVGGISPIAKKDVGGLISADVSRATGSTATDDSQSFPVIHADQQQPARPLDTPPSPQPVARKLHVDPINQTPPRRDKAKAIPNASLRTLPDVRAVIKSAAPVTSPGRPFKGTLAHSSIPAATLSTSSSAAAGNSSMMKSNSAIPKVHGTAAPSFSELVAQLREFHDRCDWQQGVELGESLLAAPSFKTGAPIDRLETLHLVGRCCVQCSKHENARDHYEKLQTELLKTSALSRREHIRWEIRVHLNMAQLHEANLLREEAAEQYVLAWRLQATLFGTEALTTLRTYLSIAEMKMHLLADRDAWQMLTFLADSLAQRISDGAEGDAAGIAEDPAFLAQCRVAWAASRRLEADIHARQGRHREKVELLRATIRATMRDEGVLRIEDKLRRSLHLELGLMLISYAESLLVMKPSAAADAEKDQSGVSTASVSRSAAAVSGGVNDSDLVRDPADELMAQAAHNLPVSTRTECLEAAMAALDDGEELLRDVFPTHHRVNVRLKLLRFRSTLTSSGLEAAMQSAASAVAPSNKKLSTAVTEKITKVAAGVQELATAMLQGQARGGDHPHTLTEVLEFLGDINLYRHDSYAAAKAYKQALGSAKSFYAADHEACSLLQHKLAEALMASGRHDDAFHLLLELKEWRDACPKNRMPPIPNHVLLHSMANCQRLRERYDDAFGLYEATLVDPGCDLGTKCRAMGNVAAMQLAAGDAIGAKETARRALQHRRAFDTDPSLEQATELLTLASLELRTCGKAPTGIASVERHVQESLQILSAVSGESGDVASIKAKAEALLAEARRSRR